MRYSEDTGEAIMNQQEQAHYDMNMEVIDRAHQHYKNMLAAFEASCIKNRILPTFRDLEVFMEGVTESMPYEIDDAIKAIAKMGFHVSDIPDNEENLKDEAYERIVDEFRLQSIKFDFLAMSKPMGVK